MLRGSHSLTMDDKGRIAIPTRYRDLFQEESDGVVICTISVNQRCLMLYPLHEWEQVERKLIKLSDMDPQQSRVKRLLLGNANEAEIDKKNGRLLIPAPLRNYARMQKQLLLSGRINKFEIWAQEEWDKQMEDDILAMQSPDSELSPALQGLSL
ncbi:cell division/cell wall cluster transcriptional repressor MraZ [Saccharobesus litoralis]|uniref:Transcriptional regulator MraZ n=1 Tax=Saccharobesus litoralis TaxID=2172099 RepID=A0A2S0VX12_9ALTE|nr:division/cell wall cluster transcriptional repressor MraZ [Saccharobesus litoralis]AWB68749.1 cell division/cell wall cluster transcriptional repressor MraZ [Saccharobesus litoralis]